MNKNDIKLGLKTLRVKYHNCYVGTLALTNHGKVAFSYDKIIKFPTHVDSRDIGYQEYMYSKCAKECSINMTETKFFASRLCKGYFGTVRFDRIEKNGEKCKIHMASAAALLEADYKAPCMDYHTLMKLTRILTRENKEDLENMFRRMCFNVFAHNIRGWKWCKSGREGNHFYKKVGIQQWLHETKEQLSKYRQLRNDGNCLFLF